MAKFLIGMAIIAFTSYCGYFFAKKYRQRKTFYQEFVMFNERFINEISFTRRPIIEFIERYEYRGEFWEVLREFLSGLDEREQDDTFWLNHASYHFLTKEELRMTEDYFLMLGKGDSYSQKNYFLTQKEPLQKLRNQAEESAKRYGDLYIKLGFLCGLLILILII